MNYYFGSGVFLKNLLKAIYFQTHIFSLKKKVPIRMTVVFFILIYQRKKVTGVSSAASFHLSVEPIQIFLPCSISFHICGSPFYVRAVSFCVGVAFFTMVLEI